MRKLVAYLVPVARHILDSLNASQSTVALNGIIEADGAFLDLSFKGNHTSDGFKMPRESQRRGHTSVQRAIPSTKFALLPPLTARRTLIPFFPISASPVR